MKCHREHPLVFGLRRVGLSGVSEKPWFFNTEVHLTELKLIVKPVLYKQCPRYRKADAIQEGLSDAMTRWPREDVSECSGLSGYSKLHRLLREIDTAEDLFNKCECEVRSHGGRRVLRSELNRLRSRWSQATRVTWDDILLTAQQDLECRKLPPTAVTYEVAGQLSNNEAVAVADTGACINTISASYAARHGLVVMEGSEHRKKITTLNKNTVMSRGAVRLKWCFANDPEEHDVLFHVMKRSPHSVIFGLPFLKATETLHKHSHRIEARRRQNSEVSRLRRACFQGTGNDELSTLEGRLAGKRVSALADTGSEVNIMSLHYAQARGLQVDTHDDQRETLQFADGSTTISEGRVYAHWQIEGRNDQSLLQFEVLEHSQFDVVLGQDFVFGSVIFDQRDGAEVPFAYLHEFPGTKVGLNPVNAVRRLPFLTKMKKKKPRDTKARDDELIARKARDAEAERHAKAEELIASMPDGALKNDAIDAERRALETWRQHHGQSAQASSRSSDSTAK